MTQPTILVDMDGVIADFDQYLLDVSREDAYRWPDGYTVEDQRFRFSTELLGDKVKWEIHHQIICEPGFYADLPVIPGALEGLDDLSRVADVWLCSKPLENNPTCRDDKGRWVRRHLGKDWEKRLILAADKSMVRGDILLDDAPKAAWLDRASWQAVVYPWPWQDHDPDWAHLRDLPMWRWGDPIDDLLRWTPDRQAQWAAWDAGLRDV